MDLDILYEDDDLLVLNKPMNMVVHPGHGNYTGTLVVAFYITSKTCQACPTNLSHVRIGAPVGQRHHRVDGAWLESERT